MELQGVRGRAPGRARGRKDRIRDLEPKAGRALPSQDAPVANLAPVGLPLLGSRSRVSSFF